jgi:signal peptidase I
MPYSKSRMSETNNSINPRPSDPPLAPLPPRRSSLYETTVALSSTVGVILLSFIVALGIITYVFQSYQVDGPSMQNTLHNNDRLIVWKLSRSWSRVTHHQYVPKRGDIVIFTETNLAEYGQDNTKQLIKRVIGLPGDRVVVGNGVITIYNAAHPHGFKPDTTLPYGKNGTIPFTAGNIDITLAKNQLYVCGDNRGDSLDSRIFGPISTNQIVGKLAARVFPINGVEKF